MNTLLRTPHTPCNVFRCTQGQQQAAPPEETECPPHLFIGAINPDPVGQPADRLAAGIIGLYGHYTVLVCILHTMGRTVNRASLGPSDSALPRGGFGVQTWRNGRKDRTIRGLTTTPNNWHLERDSVLLLNEDGSLCDGY